MFQKTLKEANRYGSIIRLLTRITNDNHTNYPVSIYAGRNGKAYSRVTGSTLREQAQMVLDVLRDRSSSISIPKDSFEELYRYISHMSDMHLHNYAIQLAHRIVPDEKDMEDIRCWLILNHLVYCCFYAQTSDENNWTIPDGWKYKGKLS